MDLDFALRTKKLATLADKSFADEKWDFDEWNCSDRTSLMIMKLGIS